MARVIISRIVIILNLGLSNMDKQQIYELLKNKITGINNIVVLATSGNLVYKIGTKDQVYFLKLSPDDEVRGRTRSEILAEVEFVKYLNENKLPVPKPMGNVISIDGHNGYLRRYYQANYIENPNLSQIISFGKTLGQIHRISEGYMTSHNREHIWDLETTKENLAKDRDLLCNGLVGGGEFYNELFQALRKIVDLKKLPKGMIHEDLGKRHVLWSDNKIKAIIDFDRCYYGYLIFDLGQAVRGWCFNGSFNREKYILLIKSYQTERKLLLEEIEYLPKAIIFAFLERSLSFALRSILSDDPSYYQYAKELLNTANSIDKNRQLFQLD